MKKITFLALLLCYGYSSAQKIDHFEMIPLKGFYTNPVVSPNGEYLLLTGEHLKGVYLMDTKTQKIKQITTSEGAGYGYSWNPDSETIYYRLKEEGDYYANAKIIAYNLKTETKKGVSIESAKFLPNFKGEKTTENLVSIDYETLQLQVSKINDLKTTKTLTNDQGAYFHPIVSNDGKKVAVHNGADIWVYSLDGQTNPIKVGSGLASTWSADDKYILGYLDESNDGHIVSNSDLYLFDIENQKTIKITDTEIIAEMHPTMHNNIIYYADDKSGRILMSKLNLK
nr:hypothetical protein [uncultured Flavobacterium sp.]